MNPKMDKFHQRIQKLLMKKEEDYGKLSNLSSKITAESIIYIDAILDDIVKICEECEIPTGKKNLHEVHESVEAFKFLLLNTNFECKELLIEDEEHGHLVGMCPPLSPYLLVEILWRLNLEQILSHSVPFLPLDLTVELLPVVTTCINTLHFDRSLELLTNLIHQILQKMSLAKTNGVQSKNPEKLLKDLFSIAEGMIFLFCNEKFLRLSDLKGNAKYKRFGLVLKQLIGLAKSSIPVIVNPGDGKLFELSFGRMEFEKSGNVDEYVELLCKEIMKLLMKKVKDVDIHCYMAWVEVQDIEDPSITLQSAIGHEAYFLVEKFKDDEQLADYLGNFVVKPEEEIEVSYATMTLEELIGMLQKENGACMKEIMNRYKYWDLKTFDSVTKHSALMDSEDASILLDYLVTVMNGSYNEEHKNSVHHKMLTTLVRFKSKDLTAIVLKFILKYDGSNVLECTDTKSQFLKFIEQNPNFNQSIDYKRLLIFLMKNPREIMKILVKASIGRRDFNTMLSRKNFFILEPFMVIKDYQNESLLLTALRDVLLENIECKVTILRELLKHIIIVWPSRNQAIHEITEVVLLPYFLQNSYVPFCLNEVLLASDKILPEYKEPSKVLMALAKKLSYVRKDKEHSRFETADSVGFLMEAMYKCRLKQGENLIADKIGVVFQVDPFLSPYDSVQLWFTSSSILHVPNVFHKYERLCFSAITKVQNCPKIDADLKRYLQEFTFQENDFLRHMILGLTIWDVTYPEVLTEQFRNDKLSNLNTETGTVIAQACRLCLEYPEDFAPLAFPTMLKICSQLMGYVWKFRDPKECLKTLRCILKDIEYSVRATPYAQYYEIILDTVPVNVGDDPTNLWPQIERTLEQFMYDCVNVGKRYEFSGGRCPRVTGYRICHKFIEACLAVTRADTNNCLEKIKEIFCVRK